VQPEEVTLSENACSVCTRLGVEEADVKQARAGSPSCDQGVYLLLCRGTLYDGRTARLRCGPLKPSHVVTWRPEV
jgi:hypothetical protein